MTSADCRAGRIWGNPAVSVSPQQTQGFCVELGCQPSAPTRIPRRGSGQSLITTGAAKGEVLKHESEQPAPRTSSNSSNTSMYCHAQGPAALQAALRTPWSLSADRVSAVVTRAAVAPQNDCRAHSSARSKVRWSQCCGVHYSSLEHQRISRAKLHHPLLRGASSSLEPPQVA